MRRSLLAASRRSAALSSSARLFERGQHHRLELGGRDHRGLEVSDDVDAGLRPVRLVVEEDFDPASGPSSEWTIIAMGGKTVTRLATLTH